MSDLKTVLRDLSNIFIAVGAMSFLPLLVPLYYYEYYAIAPLLITCLLFLQIGLIMFFLFQHAEPTNFKSAMVTAALGWLFIPLISAIPFLFMPYNVTNGATMSMLSAFFESMSGWTGTGLTMVDKEQLLPYSLQFWRTWIQWIGGVGVIVLTLSILSRPGVGSFVLYRGEAREKRTHPSIISTVRTIWWIFLLYTILGIGGLLFICSVFPNGMNSWEALNHAMTAIATGGFSVTDKSITGFGTICQLFIVVLMFAGAIAFAAHFDLLKGRIRRFFSDTQIKAMVVIVLIGVALLVIININSQNPLYSTNVLLAIRDSGFQLVSALTCTGLYTVDINTWTESAKLLLSLTMIIGGAAGSTAGGIKLFRAILLFKGAGWRVKRTISVPRRVFIRKFGGRCLPEKDAMDLVNEAAIVSFIWILMLIVGFFVMAFIYPEETIGNIFFEVCSAQGNAGLSVGLTSLSMDPLAKIMLIFNMWIGRLEIIPVVVLLRLIVGIKRNIF